MSDVNANPAPNPTPNPDPNPAPAPESTGTTWLTGLDDETRGWVENKGFKDPSAMIESYRNFEKLMGVPKERLLKLPEKSDDPAWNDIYGRLGRPGDPKEYDLKDFQDEKFAEFSKKAFHELGITKRQAETLAAKWKEYFEEGSKAQQEAAELKAAQEESDLKKEWGNALQTNTNIAKRAAQVFGLDADTIDGLEQAMGYKKTMTFLHMIGSKLGEGTFVSGEGAGNTGALTPSAAINQINSLMADPGFAKRYLEGDSEARAKMDHLHKMAYSRPG